MCKGRNIKIIKTLEQEIGLKSDLIVSSVNLFKKEGKLLYYTCFVNLYNTIILDVIPLIKISTFSNHTFILDDIRNFNIEGKSYQIFKDLIIERHNS